MLAGIIGWVAVRPDQPGRDRAGGAPGSITDPNGPNGSTSTGPAAAPGQDEIAAVLQVLGQHASALTSRNQAGWAAGLDPAPAASGYRNQELGAFAALADVPLSVWRWVLLAPVTDPSVLRPAAARLGGRVVVLHVQLQYGLRRVDPLPTAKDEWLTAVHRPAGWRLAADTDTETAGGASWHGPWDYGPLLVRAGPHTLVLAHPAHRAELATFADLVERSIPVVTSVWGNGWNEQVAVLVPDSAAEFAAVTGDQADSHDIAAVAVADSENPDPKANPATAVLGARIVLNPVNLSQLDAAGRRLVIQHELTHVATRAETDDQMPTWLIEGFADYVGNLGSGRTSPDIAAELTSEVRAGRIPAALPADSDFDNSAGRLPQLYEEAWLACRLIADRIGQHGLVRFYTTVAGNARLDPSTAVRAALRTQLHTDLPAFTASWRTYLRTQLG
ncbi:MAG: hypothetical protein ACJ74U_12795 [Jatrophihabitantaceae bacterium]